MKSERFLIVFLVVAAAVVASNFMSPIVAAMLIPAATFGIILLGHPRAFLFFYLMILSINPLVQQNFSGGPLKYVNELMGVLLFAVFLGHLSMRRLDLSRIGKWTTSAFFFLGYVGLTWLANRGSPRGAVQCLFAYLSFIPFYILCVNYLKQSDFYVFLKVGILFFWLNFILNIGWILNMNPLVNIHVWVDLSQGVLGGCNFVAYYCIVLFFLLVSVLNSSLLAGRKAMRAWIIITLPVLLVQLYLTYTNHAYLFFALALIPYGIVTGMWKKVQSWIVIIMLIGTAVLAFAHSEQVQKNISKENLRYRYDKLVYSAKVQLFNDLAVENLRTDPMKWMIGAGPGNGMGPIGKDNLTPFALKMLLPYYQGADMRTMQMTSITGSTSSAVFTLWGDFGIIGLIMYGLLYISFLIKCFKTAVADGRDEKKKVIAEFVVGAMAMLILVNTVIDALDTAVLTLGLWAWLALFSLPEEEGNMKTEGGSQKTEGGGLKTEIKRQRSGIRNQISL